MVSIARVAFGRLVAPQSNLSGVLARGITSKALRSEMPPESASASKPKPWPYNTKRFNIFHHLYDRTSWRFDENTKIIVVEGPIAAGKSKVAKELAKEFDFLYLPEANLDMFYYNDVGFDLRSLDDQLPESYRSFDVNNFMVTPKHHRAAAFQHMQYGIKYSQYVDALAHVFSTGQGVVLDRCVYSDFVFIEAMRKAGYVSKGAYDAYYAVRKNSIGELLRPHLIIYLDVPVAGVIANANKRNYPYEKDSPVLQNAGYLADMERHYKQGYLKEMSKHAELLVYDWSEGGDVEVLIEDVERIDFDHYDSQDTKMKDWDYGLEEEYACARYLYSDKKDQLMTLVDIPNFGVPELVASAEEAKVYHDLMETIPGERYLKGYDPSLGDSGILFKTSAPHRHPLPIRERRFNAEPGQ